MEASKSLLIVGWVFLFAQIIFGLILKTSSTSSLGFILFIFTIICVITSFIFNHFEFKKRMEKIDSQMREIAIEEEELRKKEKKVKNGKRGNKKVL